MNKIKKINRNSEPVRVTRSTASKEVRQIGKPVLKPSFSKHKTEAKPKLKKTTTQKSENHETESTATTSLNTGTIQDESNESYPIIGRKRKHVKIEYDSVQLEIIKKDVDENTTTVNSSSEDEIIKDSEALQSTKIYGSCINTPLNWVQVLNNIREMRKNSNAPIDSTDWHKCDEDLPPEVIRYHKLISLMLSSQTKDQITDAAMQRLVNHGCTVRNILETSDKKLGELIYPVAFWKTKVKYIKRTSEILQNEYKSDIPTTVKDLCKLHGVGPKMAHICMRTAWGQITGIGVDTHIHRISNRLGWVKTKTPDETRKSLEAWLPIDLWSEVDYLLVGFGQQICQSIKPRCVTCLNYQLCPFGIDYIKDNKAKKAK